MNSENDTGILVTSLSQTIEESRRLREEITHSRQKDTAEPRPPDGASPGENVPGQPDPV